MWITLAHITEVHRTGNCRRCHGSGLREVKGQEPLNCMECFGTGADKLDWITVQPIDTKTRRAFGKASRLTRLDLVTVVDLPSREV